MVDFEEGCKMGDMRDMGQTSPALRAPSLLGEDAEHNFDHPS